MIFSVVYVNFHFYDNLDKPRKSFNDKPANKQIKNRKPNEIKETSRQQKYFKKKYF